jgi:nucleotide-binding universal stress UspA family protein
MSQGPSQASTGEPILVGVDGSDNAKEALRVAAELSQVLDAPLEAVMCWQDPLQFYEGYYPLDTETVRAGSEKALQATITEVFGEQPPANLTTRLLRGRAAEQLIEASKGARLLVVGRRGTGGVLGAILGSVSSSLVSHAHCSVLVVRT